MCGRGCGKHWESSMCTISLTRIWATWLTGRTRAWSTRSHCACPAHLAYLQRDREVAAQRKAAMVHGSNTGLPGAAASAPGGQVR